MTNAYILGIDIYKFCYWQELCLIILLKIDKNIKINIYCIILTLYLSINLKAKRGKKLILDAKKIVKQKPKL